MPIIMLTARARIRQGARPETRADDYVTKPFSIKELLARAEAFLRRRRKSETTAFEFGDCRLDTERATLERAGEDVPLSPKESNFPPTCRHTGAPQARQHHDQRVGLHAMVHAAQHRRFVNACAQNRADPTEPVSSRTVREFRLQVRAL